MTAPTTDSSPLPSAEDVREALYDVVDPDSSTA
jgi:hypothetical protein